MGSSPSVAELPGWAHALLLEARVARLGLCDGRDAPRVLPITYALEDGSLVTAIDHKRKQHPDREPARVRWLRERPRAAITVDRYEEDWSVLAWVQALGSVTVLDAAAAPGAITALRNRYSQYNSRPPGGPVLRLTPDRLLWWRA